MAKSIPALINPKMLVWARETARLSLPEAAAKLKISEEKLAECEAGTATLTFPQLMKAASEYKRTVSLFYLESPPEGWQPIQDFRRLQDASNGFSPKLAYIVRQAHERRELALDLRADLNEPIQEFKLSADLKQSPEAVGEAIRAYLGVTQTQQQQWRLKAFEGWRTLMEAKDVLVFTVPRLDLNEMRGAALAERLLPVILVNSRDRFNGRTFTLLHEFCHLAIRQSGVSGPGGDRDDAPNPRVELFCNAAAAAALMPREWLLSEPIVLNKGNVKTWADDELKALALRFGVSREVVLRRLLTLNKTTQAFYNSMRPVFQKEYADLEEKKSTGGPEYPVTVLSQLGRSFTTLIFQGYHERRLTLRDVANYLNMQVKLVPQMERLTFGVGA